MHSGKVVCSRKIWQPMVTELLRRLAVQKVMPFLWGGTT
jgi:hypothetical protein